MDSLIAYYRVSTQMQGARGLGMAAQRSAVAAFAKMRGVEILAEYEEVETARRDSLQNRPELQRALRHAKRCRAVLVIARLDRLARNVLVTSQLLESGVEFVACDNPYANRMTIQIIAVMAEQESRLISERTKAALAARRASGILVPPGHRFTAEDAARGRLAAARSHRRKAREAYRDVAPVIVQMRAAGSPLALIVERLNERGECNQFGRQFDVQVVRRILAREGAPLLPSFLSRRDDYASAVRARGVQRGRETVRRKIAAAFDAAQPIALELYNSGASRLQIADRLTALGLALHTGRPWNRQNIVKLLVAQKPVRRDRCTRAQIDERLSAATAAKRKAASEAFEPVQRIFEHLRGQGMLFNEIAQELNLLGYLPPKASRWTGHLLVQTVRRHGVVGPLRRSFQ